MAPVGKPKTVSASSLVEVTVAMIIIVTVFGMALSLYLNVVGGGSTLQKIRHRLLLIDYAQQTKREKAYLDDTRELEGITLKRTITPYEGNPNLLLLEVQVWNEEQDSVLARHRELIYEPYEAH